MLFKRSRNTTNTGGDPSPALSSHDETARLLDLVGTLTAAYIRGCFDMPRLPAAESQEQLELWRRHALLGTPVSRSGERPLTLERDDANDQSDASRHVAVGIDHRDWRGVTSAFADHRWTERQFVEKALGDLRDALWVCIERAHQALVADETADDQHRVQLDRVRGALEQLETGAVKNEIAQAMEAIQQATRTRQGAQLAAYRDLTAQVEQLGRQLDDARRQGETDALTGLGNRLAFDRTIARQVALHGLSRAPLCVLLIDLDRLKPINDTHGHAAGDQALLAVTKALHKVFLGDGDQLCRIGGDEFAVVLPNSALALGERLAQRFHAVLAEEPWPFADGGLILSASVGVAEWRVGETSAEWIGRADAAMYANKASRRAAA